MSRGAGYAIIAAAEGSEVVPDSRMYKWSSFYVIAPIAFLILSSCPPFSHTLCFHWLDRREKLDSITFNS